MTKPPKTKNAGLTERLWIRLSPEQKKTLEQKATESGLSVSDYLRKSGCEQEIKSKLDHVAIEKILLVNADLGRMGGLLKLWLSHPDSRDTPPEVRQLLQKIEGTQDILRRLIWSFQ